MQEVNGVLLDKTSKKILGKVENGYPIGYYRTFHSNGNIEGEGFFNENYKEDGEIKTYYKNGQLEAIVEMKNGIFEGYWKEFYENGKPKSVSFKTSFTFSNC